VSNKSKIKIVEGLIVIPIVYKQSHSVAQVSCTSTLSFRYEIQDAGKCSCSQSGRKDIEKVICVK
jgi:hypothetical protein